MFATEMTLDRDRAMSIGGRHKRDNCLCYWFRATTGKTKPSCESKFSSISSTWNDTTCRQKQKETEVLF